MRIFRYCLIFFNLLLALGSVVAVSAQYASDSVSLDSDQAAILREINNRRPKYNLVPFVANPILNDVAQDFLADYVARAKPVQDVFKKSDDTEISSLLAQYGYQPYSDGFIVDFIPLRLTNVRPDELLDYWLQNRPPSLRIAQNNPRYRNLPPYDSNLFREVGIAYQHVPQDGSEGEKYYYVLVFAAQPQKLPVLISTFSEPGDFAATIQERDVILHVHDENTHSNGDNGSIGKVLFVHISESADVLDCPPTGTQDPPPGWLEYRTKHLWELSDGAGPKTVYVQMCDVREQSVVASARVNYLTAGGQTPTMPVLDGANVLDIAHATQTAAANATAAAPYLPTVNAILTSTASVLPTSTPAP